MDGAIDVPDPVITIADIFKGPLEGEDPAFGDEVADPGGRIIMQDTPGAPSDPPPDIPIPAPDSGDESGYFVHPLTGRRYKQDEYGENVRKTGRPPYISVEDHKENVLQIATPSET